MIKIFDTHTDIMYDLYEKTTRGEQDIFNRYHQSHLFIGGIMGGIWTIYSDHDFDIIKAYKTALEELSKNDISKYKIVFGIEGMRNVHTLDHLKQLHQLGVRHGGLTWNEENHLATGVKGPQNKGLTTQGKEFIDFMVQNNMIVDLAHLNVKSFFDVLNCNQKNILVSHSNAYEVCNHIRNLSDEQIKAIGQVNGLIGVVAAKNFVSSNLEKQTSEGLVDHIVHITNLIGVRHISVGFDFMNYLEGYANANLQDIPHAGEAQKLVNVLEARGFSTEDIEKICYSNIIRFIEEVERT